MIFTSEDGQPLPAGTAIDLLPYLSDAGILGYAPTGEQIVAHYSRLHRTMVLSLPEYFNPGRVPVRITTCVLSAEDGQRIWRNAVDEIEKCAFSVALDSLYDFVVRAYSGADTNAAASNFSGLAFLGGFASAGHLLTLPKFRLSFPRL